MAWRKYFVIRHEGGWVVLHDGQRSVVFADQADAIQSAVEQAQDEWVGGEQEEEPRVLVIDDDMLRRDDRWDGKRVN